MTDLITTIGTYNYCDYESCEKCYLYEYHYQSDPPELPLSHELLELPLSQDDEELESLSHDEDEEPLSQDDEELLEYDGTSRTTSRST